MKRYLLLGLLCGAGIVTFILSIALDVASWYLICAVTINSTWTLVCAMSAIDRHYKMFPNVESAMLIRYYKAITYLSIGCIMMVMYWVGFRIGTGPYGSISLAHNHAQMSALIQALDNYANHYGHFIGETTMHKGDVTYANGRETVVMDALTGATNAYNPDGIPFLDKSVIKKDGNEYINTCGNPYGISMDIDKDGWCQLPNGAIRGSIAIWYEFGKQDIVMAKRNSRGQLSTLDKMRYERTDANGNTMTYGYDDQNRRISTTNAAGETSTTTFVKGGQ
jgi:YD repeat-containing protein